MPCDRVFFRVVAQGREGVKRPKAITSLSEAFTTACRKAGCPGRTPHDLRRTAVRDFVREGIPQTVAMKLTGHLTESVFRRIRHREPERSACRRRTARPARLAL
jgi:integrase